MGRVVSISSGDWVGVWVGLEVNLFGVVPFFFGAGSVKEVEAVVKYYVVQSVGSMVMLFGVVVSYMGLGFFFLENVIVGGVGCVGLVGGLVMKMGLVPFHFWVPRVIGGLD